MYTLDGGQVDDPRTAGGAAEAGSLPQSCGAARSGIADPRRAKQTAADAKQLRDRTTAGRRGLGKHEHLGSRGVGL